MDKTIGKIKKGNSSLYLFILYLFFLFFYYNTPLTGDDWTWGTEIGWNRFERMFHDYNGRYLSNMIELLVVRVDLLRYLILALFSALLVYIMGKLTNYNNNPIAITLAFILVMAMPIRVFSQTMAWSAGFLNYVPSVMLLLVYLYIIRNIYREEPPEYHKYAWLYVIPLGLATQLIVEHVTLFAAVTSAWVIAYTYWKHKKFYAVHIAYLVSATIGAAIMFTNTAYLKVLSGEDSYRTMENDITAGMGIFERTYYIFSGNMYQFLFTQNVLLNVILGILALVIIMRFKTAAKWMTFGVKPVLVSIITFSMLFLLAYRDILRPNFLGELTNDFEAVLYALFFGSIVISVILFVSDKMYKTRILYYLFGVAFMIAPFVFITPFGPRGVLASYIFMVLIALEMLAYSLKGKEAMSMKVAKPLMAVALSTVLIYAYIFGMNGAASRDRLEHLQQEVNAGAQVIEMKELPFSQFHWMPSPKPDMYHTKTFKMFYGVPEDTELKIVPYRE